MAAPNPERELQRLRGALRAGIPPIVVVTGASGFFRNEAFESVVAALPEHVELRRIDGNDDSDGRELGDLRGGSLFGSGTWLLVRRADKWLDERRDDLTALLQKGFAKGCGLLVETPKLDRRTKLSKALEAGGGVFEFRDLYAEPYDRSRSPLEAELVGWVQTRARQKRVPLTPDAALLVVASVGKDLAELVAELDRLAQALPAGAARVGPAELRAHLSVGFESTPFEFADAVLAFDRAGAMRSLQAMFARGVRGRDGRDLDAGGVFPFVVSWLHQSLTTAHLGRALLDSGVRRDDVPRRLGARTFVDRLLRQVEDNPEPRLRAGIVLLRDAQRELRTTGEDPELLLERFVQRYFAAGAP